MKGLSSVDKSFNDLDPPRRDIITDQTNIGWIPSRLGRKLPAFISYNSSETK